LLQALSSRVLIAALNDPKSTIKSSTGLPPKTLRIGPPCRSLRLADDLVKILQVSAGTASSLTMEQTHVHLAGEVLNDDNIGDFAPIVIVDDQGVRVLTSKIPVQVSKKSLALRPLDRPSRD